MAWATPAWSQEEGEEQPLPPEAQATDGAPEEGEEEEPEEIEEGDLEEEEPLIVDQATFDEALDDFYAKRFDVAAAGFWAYIHFGDQAAENYEWAQYFLGECLRNLGLWHGAVQYYYIVARTRSRPEILPDALRQIERVSRRRPFAEDMIYEELLYDSEFGVLPNDLSDWVQYIQGLYDFKNGFLRWARKHFSAISPKSYYSLKAAYVEGVHALRQKRDDKALAYLDSIITNEVFAPEIKNRAHLATARLLFDLGQYEAALESYSRVEQIDLSFEQAELILEKAWAHYHQGRFRKAMGLLHALHAPSYKHFFLPDAFLLRGLIFKDLCHFIEAKRSIRNFRFTYGRTLEEMHRRVPMENNKKIFEAATQTGTIGRRTALLRTLEAERRMIEDYDSVWEDVELDSHLRRLYDFQIREQARLWRLAFEGASDAVALDLLNIEEQINLLDYEIGLDIFKRLKGASARTRREEPLLIPYDSANIYYEFDTEFWNDELHSYQYFIGDRCIETLEEN